MHSWLRPTLLLVAATLASPSVAESIRRIAGVMLRGRWIDRAELDARLAGIASRQASR